MKTSATSKKFAGGFALLAMLACLVIILIVFAAVMVWVTTNAKQMQKNEQFTTSEAAAEGASEVIYANMDRDYLYGNLNTAINYENLTPDMTGWPVQYAFAKNVTLGSQTATLQYLDSEYAGLLGEPQTNIITVTATPQNQLYNVPATVSQTYVFAIIPAFQFAIFYNINLEIDPGGSMPIRGAVFSNGSIWSGTPNVTYSSTVEAAGQVNTSGTDPFATGKTDASGGTPQANFQYAGPPAQPESNVNPLVLPVGASSGANNTSTNVQAIIEVPPATVAAPQTVAYEETNLVYDFNAATLLVSNSSWGVSGGAPWSNNFTVYLQDPVTSPSAVPANWNILTNDVYIYSNSLTHSLYPTNYVPNFRFVNNMSTIQWTGNPAGTNTVWYAGFSFLTNVTFYDYREKATVQAVQLDVGKLGTWITNAAANGGSNWNQEVCEDLGSHGINSVFVDNTVGFISQSQLPAVRVVDGQLLPYSTCTTANGPIFTCGLTVVTPQPLYVLGNYNVQTNGGPVDLGSHNTADTFPAAFMADSITILSSNWNDSAYTSGTGATSRMARNTTVNAACLEGIVSSSGGNYSGGVENFLRLLEDWSGVTLTYNGSIMVMFDSQYATSIWQAPNGATSYYYVPTRNWSFDTNYLIEADLPPLTPNFRAVIRNTWQGY